MQRITLKVINQVGLHARPASEFVRRAAQFKSIIQVRNLSRSTAWVDAKSILSVLTLGVEKDHEIELTAEGPDELQAIQSLRALVETDLDGKL